MSARSRTLQCPVARTAASCVTGPSTAACGRALESLALPHVGLHALRHSAAARVIAARASAKVVQTVLGHRSAAFTLTVYGHLFDADLDALAALLDGPAAPPRPQLVAL